VAARANLGRVRLNHRLQQRGGGAFRGLGALAKAVDRRRRVRVEGAGAGAEVEGDEVGLLT
jgi:hypothetical protein